MSASETILYDSGRGAGIVQQRPEIQTDQTKAIREAPFNKVPPLFGHCPFGGGGLNPCPEGLGHLFRDEHEQF